MAISVRAQPFTAEFLQPDDVGFDAPFRCRRNLLVIPLPSRKRIHDQRDEFCRKFNSLSPRHHHSYALRHIRVMFREDIGSLDVKGFTSEGLYYLILSHESKGISLLIRGDSIRSLIQDVFRLTFYSSEPSEVCYCRTTLSRSPTFYRSAHLILSLKSAIFRYSGKELELRRTSYLSRRRQWVNEFIERLRTLQELCTKRRMMESSLARRKLMFRTDSANSFVRQHDAGLYIDVDGISEELLPKTRGTDAYRNIGAPGISLASALNKSLNIWWKEILDSFNGNPELARDDLTWF
ncbi:hypothetical protein PVK06_032557 [Gossypium arboreum]|uniref:Uncharacterized protein n=1 Tax=Gossypium arboreum TaxID=29729 RepID=A0ABR0NUA5_GOSAR|nr:hypothetical protein PVK06_032557 [Gossypium arboreum]